MPRFAAVVVFLSAVALASAWIGAARSVDAGARVPSGQPAVSPCTVVVSKTAGPDPVLLGRSVAVTLTARAACPPAPLHVVFALDESASSAAYSGTINVSNQATRMVGSLDMARHTGVRGAAVTFNTKARTQCPLTDNETRLLGGLRQLLATGDTAIQVGIERARRVLQEGRAEVDGGTLAEVIVVVSDGINMGGCDAAVRASRMAQTDGIRVMAIAIHPSDPTGASCMRRIASSPGDYFPEDAAGIGRALPPIRDRYPRLIEALSIEDNLSPAVEYVGGSACPAPLEGPTGPALAWRFGDDAAGLVTASLRVRALAVGRIATNAGATGVLTDVVGRRLEFSFPVPWIEVVAPATAELPPPEQPTTSAPTARPPTGEPTEAVPTAEPTTQRPSRRNACYLPSALRSAR